MAFNLANLAQIGSAAGGDMPNAEMQWQRVLAQRQALQDQQRQRQAMALLFSGLSTPIDAALPQQGPPGMPPQVANAPMLKTQPAPFGVRPTDAALQSAGAPAPAAAPPPTPGGAAPGPAASPVGGGPLSFPDPMARLRQVARQLKAANPGVDDLTLATALEQQVTMARGLEPEDRAMLQAETRIMQIQAQAENNIRAANSRAEVAKIRADASQAIADARLAAYRDASATASADRRYGIDVRAGTAATAETGRNTRAAARIDQSTASGQVKQQYKALAAKRSEIKDQISAFQNGTPGAPDAATVKQLQGQLSQLDQQITALWSRNQSLPRPSELERMGGGESVSAAPAGGGGGNVIKYDAQGNRVQ